MAEEDEVKDSNREVKEQYYAWDEEQGTAYRVEQGCRKQVREYAVKVSVEGLKDEDQLLAVFVDGSTWRIPSITVGEYKLRDEVTSTRSSPHWEGPGGPGGGLVSVQDSNREGKLSYIMWHKKEGSHAKSQCLQIQVQAMDQKERERMKEFMVQQAQAFARNEVSKSDMKIAKGKILADMVPVKKRPASTSADEASHAIAEKTDGENICRKRPAKAKRPAAYEASQAIAETGVDEASAESSESDVPPALSMLERARAFWLMEEAVGKTTIS